MACRKIAVICLCNFYQEYDCIWYLPPVQLFKWDIWLTQHYLYCSLKYDCYFPGYLLRSGFKYLQKWFVFSLLYHLMSYGHFTGGSLLPLLYHKSLLYHKWETLTNDPFPYFNSCANYYLFGYDTKAIDHIAFRNKEASNHVIERTYQLKKKKPIMESFAAME